MLEWVAGLSWAVIVALPAFRDRLRLPAGAAFRPLFLDFLSKPTASASLCLTVSTSCAEQHTVSRLQQCRVQLLLPRSSCTHAIALQSQLKSCKLLQMPAWEPALACLLPLPCLRGCIAVLQDVQDCFRLTICPVLPLQHVPHAWAWVTATFVLGWYAQIHPGHMMLEGRRPALLDSFFQVHWLPYSPEVLAPTAVPTPRPIAAIVVCGASDAAALPTHTCGHALPGVVIKGTGFKIQPTSPDAPRDLCYSREVPADSCLVAVPGNSLALPEVLLVSWNGPRARVCRILVTLLGLLFPGGYRQNHSRSLF